MAKKKPPAKPVNKVAVRCHVQIGGLTVTVNGRTTRAEPIDYERLEYDDGRVVERGRPPGVPADATPVQVVAQGKER